MSRERSNGFLNLSVQKKLWFAAAAAAYIVLFLWLPVYDLPFSDFLTAHASEWFFQLGRRAGQLPALLVPAFCIHALGRFQKRKWYTEIICFLLCFAAALTIVIPHDNYAIEGCITLAAAIAIFLILIAASATFAVYLRLFQPVLLHHYNPETGADELIDPQNPAFEAEEAKLESEKLSDRLPRI